MKSPKSATSERARFAAWYAKNKEVHNAFRKAKRDANPEKHRAYARKQQKRQTRKNILNISREEPANCEACGILFASTRMGACLDHCHLTNHFRGWLCHNCNSALGLAGDTPEAMKRLLDYVTSAYDTIRRNLTK
jgi:hypothetical protein